MFLDQIITEESAYLKDYKDIKKSLQCKKGRIPRWYTFLKDNLTINSNNRLNIELDQPIIKSHNVERLKPPNISRDAFHHKGPSKWVTTWSPNIIDVVYGKAITSTNFEHIVPFLYAEHWIKVPLNASTSTPRSRPNIIQPCPGCQLHFPYYIGDNRISCILKIPYSKIIRAYILQKSNIDLYSSWLPTRLLKIAKVLKHNHEYYKVVAYNDYLIRGGLITADSIQADSLDNAIPGNLNYQLLTVLIKDRLIQANLWSLAQQVHHYPFFELYTDGSFNNTPGINEFHMGYGWHISNIQNQDFSYCGSIEHFPSATKAEIMAILTALIILPGGSDVTIFTDSQAAISNFQKSAHLQYVSPRRFNKINYMSLWSAIHHIIKKLSLNVKLIKVKAHSSSADNDKADALAKMGHFKTPPTSITLHGIPNLNISLEWNNEITIDKDIRKTVGKIIDYRWLDNHMNHNNLSDIYKFTQHNMINWSLTSKFFHHNSRDTYTDDKHSKDISWIIKSSTGTLPTLDFLNRNFPKLIKDDTKCMLCNSAEESNDHIWKCPTLLPHIRSTFRLLADQAQTFLQKYADKLNLCITDSIKYSNTFCWSFYNDAPITDNATLLLRSYVSEDLFRTFRTHFLTQGATIKAILKFMETARCLIKRNIWKVRSATWKDKKRRLQITKKSFKNYQRDPRMKTTRAPRRHNIGYICPQTVSLYNNYNRSDLIFIILASSNFLHSSVFFNQLTYDLSDDISYYSSPHYSRILMV
ncbi:hypothetical protein RirG_142450 [Rhizophagus irregularis DAOM 197198w]|uniref:RNase H type-1 domain-containing protein n=1 Tax=Rhizophagus irregularis (strain DAOM 197198w) TaxID=1432141 RepID=A0A015KAI4_RHIIW|nr:hypothetical protein RirG_142450 [Rhizophagus irregularis DAOM 197198w]